MESVDRHTIVFEQIYKKYMPVLVRFALKFAPIDEAEDIVQNTFIKYFHRDFSNYSEDDIAKQLYTSVRNACIDFLRRKATQKTLMEKQAIELKLAELDYYKDSCDRVMNEELISQVEQRINTLPAKCREIFNLVHIEGYTSTEIAKQKGISVRTVENHLYKALMILRQRCADLLSLLIVFKEI